MSSILEEFNNVFCLFRCLHTNNYFVILDRKYLNLLFHHKYNNYCVDKSRGTSHGLRGEYKAGRS